MPLSEIYAPEIYADGSAESGNRLSASVRQLEALTALAAAPREGRELAELLAGLAEIITTLTDYRSCIVSLLTDEAPYHLRVLSYSSNIPAEYAERLAQTPYPHEHIARLIDQGVRIEVGGLGFAAYYPPSHYDVLDRAVAERYKADVPRYLPDEDSQPWFEGDELLVPLITHDGEIIGLISLDDPRSGRAPDRQSVLPAIAFARQTAQLIARQRDAEKLAAQAEREALINRITRAVRQSLDTGEVFRTATRELGMHLGVDRSSIYMLDAEAGVARSAAEHTVPGVLPAGSEYELPLIAGLIEKIRECGVLAFEDVENNPAIRHIYENILKKLGTRSIMYVAIRVGGEVPGCFALSTTRENRRWHAEDMALARAVADQTGIAVRQAELYQRAEATSVRESLVNSLSHAIRASLNLPEVLHAATHELGQALRASRAYIRPYDAERAGEAQVMYEYLAPGCPSINTSTISYADPIGQFLLGTHKTFIVNDALNYECESPELSAQVRELARRNGGQSKIICPLVVQGRFRGALCIHQTDRMRCWSRDDVALVESVAAQLATGIAQAELFEMVARAKRTWEVTFDAMSDGIFIFSNEQKLIRVNKAGAGLESVEPQEILGRRCCDILRSGRGEGCIVERATAEGRAITLEYTPERLGRPLLVTAEPVVEDSGQVGTVCTVRDLTELRQIETLARERQSLLENVLESAREVICAVDPEGKIMWSNSAATALNGYERGELVGHHFHRLVEEGDREMTLEAFRRALEGEAQTIEMRVTTRGGQVRYLLADATPLVIDGRTTGVLTISRDVTEQRQERERAAQADKLRALGQLASGVAHDFNNALAAILGRAQLLRRSTRDGDEFSRGLDIILTAAEDAASTVRRIRSFAHQLPGDEFRNVDARALLHDAMEITRTRWENDARSRGLNYDVTLDGNCALHTFGNASELREVFVNLIVNAIDAMPAGGRLSIGCALSGEHLQLHFADTGAGMSEEVRARIFEPFFTTKGAQGTGLGLFVSYGIIERHEGRISVASERGRGATFMIELPYVKPETQTQEASDAAGLNANSGALSVLVVDDEETVRDTLADMVSVLGHRVEMAESGREALIKLDEGRFDLVFTDLSMPEMDGWEVAREVRRRWPLVRVAVVTGYGKEAARNLTDVPADIVIGKPFDFVQIEEVLAQFRR